MCDAHQHQLFPDTTTKWTKPIADIDIKRIFKLGTKANGLEW